MSILMFATLWSVAVVPKQVEQVVTDVIEQTLPPQSRVADIKVSYRGAIPNADVQLQASLAAPLKDNKARIRLEHVDSRGVVRAVGWANVRASICGPVLVSTTDLAPGALLTSADMHVDNRCGVDVETIQLAQQNWLGGKVRRSLRMQRVVREGDIEPRLAIERGEPVDLVYVRGPLRVRTRAEALDRGAKGANVRVRRQGQRQNIVARVIDDGVVEVSP